MSKSYNVVSPGQSGHVLSRWYDNQIDEWTSGKYHITYTDSEEYQQGAERLLLKSDE